MASKPHSYRDSAAVAPVDPRAGKYLTFQLSSEEFGIPVLNVREIMGLRDIAAVPQTPPHIKGVMNLRGLIIPITISPTLRRGVSPCVMPGVFGLYRLPDFLCTAHTTCHADRSQ